MKKRPADNERFGASGAIPRPKGSGDFEVLCLVSSAVEVPPSPSRRTLAASTTEVRTLEKGTEKNWKLSNVITKK